MFKTLFTWETAIQKVFLEIAVLKFWKICLDLYVLKLGDTSKMLRRLQITQKFI